MNPPLHSVAEPAAGNYFVSTYPPFSCWTDREIADWQAQLGRADLAASRVPLGLYVHVPFCVRRCRYCYYLAYDDKTAEIDRYVDALSRELAMLAGRRALAGRALDFVYFGGGTPSLLSSARIRRLLDGLKAVMPWSGVREVTFECAPRSVTAEKLAILREAGVTRVSLGIQQLDDDVLARNERVHQVADVERAYGAIREADFPVVNVDLIVGLAGESDSSFDRSTERVVELAPESVTFYQLEMPLNTPLYRDWRDGSLGEEPAAWTVKRERLGRGFERLEAAGYTVRSAYAAVRDPARHRFLYQDEQYRGADLLGIGASSFSHLAGVQQQNRAALGPYLEAVGSGGAPWWRAHRSSDDERLVREFVLQLKLGGVPAAPFRARYGVEIAERFAEPLAALRDAGWLELDRERVRVTRAGLLRIDRLLAAFYRPEHRGLRHS